MAAPNLGPWGGLYDPTYIGTGPGAARRRFEIARIAQELDKERFRHSWRGRLADIGGSGGGFPGLLGRIGTQLGENLSMALPGAIKIGAAGFHTFEGLATGGTHGDIMAIPHVVRDMGSAIAQDVAHPWQRPGYLLTDVALGLGALGKLGRTGAAAREAYRIGERPIPEHVPAPFEEYREPVSGRATMPSGEGAPRLPGEKERMDPIESGAAFRAGSIFSGAARGTLKQWRNLLGDELHAQAVFHQPDVPVTHALDPEGTGRALYDLNLSDSGKVQIRLPGPEDNGVASVVHIRPDGSEQLLRQQRTGAMSPDDPNANHNATILDRVARTSARELELIAAGHPHVKTLSALDPSRPFQEIVAAHENLTGSHFTGEPVVAPEAVPETPPVEPADVLTDPRGKERFGGFTHEQLDAFEEMTTRKKAKVTRIDTIARKLSLTPDQVTELPKVLKARERAVAEHDAAMSAKAGAVTDEEAAALLRASEADRVARAQEPPPTPDLAAKRQAALERGMARAAEKEQAERGYVLQSSKTAQTEQAAAEHAARTTKQPVTKVGQLKKEAVAAAVAKLDLHSSSGERALVQAMKEHHPEGIKIAPVKLRGKALEDAKKEGKSEFKSGAAVLTGHIEQALKAFKRDEAKRAAAEARPAPRKPEPVKVTSPEGKVTVVEPAKLSKRSAKRVKVIEVGAKSAEEQLATHVPQDTLEAARKLVKDDPTWLEKGKGAKLKALAMQTAKQIKDDTGHKRKITISGKISAADFQKLVAGQVETPPSRVVEKGGKLRAEAVEPVRRPMHEVPGLVEDAIRGNKEAKAELSGRLAFYVKTKAPKADIEALQKALEDVKAGEKGNPPPTPKRALKREEGTTLKAQELDQRTLRTNKRELEKAGVPAENFAGIQRGIKRVYETANKESREPQLHELANEFTAELGETVGNAAFEKWMAPKGGAEAPVGRRLRAAASTFFNPPQPGVTVRGWRHYDQPLVGGGRIRTHYPVFVHNSRNSIVQAGVRIGYRTLDDPAGSLLPKYTPAWVKKRIENHVKKEDAYIRSVLQTDNAMTEVQNQGMRAFKRALKDGKATKGEEYAYIRKEWEKIVADTHKKWDEAGRKGKVSDYIDSSNQVAVMGALFFKPAYISANLFGQLDILMIDHAWNPWSMVHSVALQRATLRKFPELRTQYHAAGGGGISEAYGFQHGMPNKLGRAITYAHRGFAQEGFGIRGRGFKRGGRVGVTFGKGGKVIPSSQSILDTPFRSNAFFNEARRNGYRTPDAIHELLTEPSLQGERLKIYARMNKNVIEYGRLNDGEKKFVRRIVFFYPWIKASTRWSIRSITEHPVVSGARIQAGRQESKDIEKKLGKLLPSYLKGGLLPVGEVMDPDLGKMPTVMNLQAITPTGSAGQIATWLGASLSQPGSSAASLSQFANPTISGLMAQLTSKDPFTGRSIPASEGSHFGIPGTRVGFSIPGSLGGRYLEGMKNVAAPYGLYKDIGRSKKLRQGEGDITQTLFPYTTSERWGKFLGPIFGAVVGHPLADYRINLKEAHSRGFAEAMASQSPYKRVLYRHAKYIQDFTKTARSAGVLGPKQPLPQELVNAIRMRGLREAALTDLKGRVRHNLTPRETLSATLGVLLKEGKISKSDATSAVRESYNADDADIKQMISDFEADYFNRDVISDWRRDVNDALTDRGRKPVAALP